MRTTECYLLADEAALKGAVGAKGSSGLRPCILCANALDKTRPEVPDHESIASHNTKIVRLGKSAPGTPLKLRII